MRNPELMFGNSGYVLRVTYYAPFLPKERDPHMPVTIPKNKYAGKVREVTIGVSNTRFTEMLTGPLKAGDELITRRAEPPGGKK